jgi:hypothetical protein
VLRGFNWKVVLAFLDDILVLGRDFEGNSNNPYLIMNAVLEQSAGLIFTCQYAELASSLEYHTFPAKN